MLQVGGCMLNEFRVIGRRKPNIALGSNIFIGYVLDVYQFSVIKGLLLITLPLLQRDAIKISHLVESLLIVGLMLQHHLPLNLFQLTSKGRVLFLPCLTSVRAFLWARRRSMTFRCNHCFSLIRYYSSFTKFENLWDNFFSLSKHTS